MKLRLFLLALIFVPAIPALRADEKAPGARRILFVGNSITLHPPAPDIGWTGNWGMAASAADKDFVHLVVDAMTPPDGAKPEFRAINAADFERGFAQFDVTGKLADSIAFHADTVVLAIGENAPELGTAEMQSAFKDSVIRLLNALRTEGKIAIYVRSCFWPNAAKDAALKEACAAVDGVFVDISALSKDARNSARSEREIAHAGVAGHPGDGGMRAIADALIEAMKKPAK